MKMVIKMPDSLNECIYFTRRSIGNGQAVAWVYKKECPKCHKAKMGKPVEKGKVRIRAKEYTCPACGFTEEKVVHEESLMVDILYTCPHCKHEGEATTEYKRRSFDGVKAYVFQCQSCKQNIGLTKKMKQKGGSKVEDDDE